MGWASEAFWREAAQANIYPNVPSGKRNKEQGQDPRKEVLFMSKERMITEANRILEGRNLKEAEK